MTSSLDRLDELRIDRRSPPGRRRAGAVVVVAATLLALGGAAWWLSRRTPAAEVAVAPVSEVRDGGAATVLDASGYVTARRRATVSSKITGKVAEVLVEEGQAVREGQLLARLDDANVRKDLDLAEAEAVAAESAVDETEVRLAEAERQLGRIRPLAEGGIASSADLDQASYEVDALRARLALARDQVAVARQRVIVARQALADTEIRAPFTGVAVSKDAQPGEMISPVSAGGGFTRTGVCTVVDMASLEIEVDVNEAYIHRVRPTQGVTAVLDAYPDWKILARVITTVPTADRQKATVRVRIAFDTLDPRILPDMGVKVSFLEDKPEGAREASRRMVPAAAVRRDGDQEVVFVVADDHVERRAVRVGKSYGEALEVLSGLAAGERVVVEGAEGLTDGDRVRVHGKS